MEWGLYLVDTKKKTPEEDFKRFEKFIDAMENIEFEYWYRYEATNKQKSLAEEIREPLTEKEHEDIYEGRMPWE